MIDPADADEVERARQAVGDLFAGVVALEGSISGEHGIGFSKAPYLGLELSADVIALMKRVKQAFDPNGILNPGKIFPRERRQSRRHEGHEGHDGADVPGAVTSSHFVNFASCLRDLRDCASVLSRWSPATPVSRSRA